MTRYTQNCPMVFGEGAVNELGSEAGNLGVTKAVVVTDEIIAKTDGYKACINSLKDAGIGVVEFTECLADPPSDSVHKASRLAKESGVNGVVGIGGGSVLDTAKGVNVLFNNPEPVTQYFGVPPKNKGYPLICIPTTAGTGSEATGIAVLTNSQTGVKGPGVFSVPTLAILDPVMTVTAPPKVTAMTGMDAFSHAAEALTAAFANLRTDLLAAEAVKLIFNALPKACDDGGDMQARTDLLLGSNLAGIAFNDSKVHLGHAIAHAAGVRFHLPHGICCALAVPQAMKYSSGLKPDKVKMIGEAMGLRFSGSESATQIGSMVAEACFGLMKRIQIPPFEEYGISRDELVGTVDLVISDVCFGFLPAPLSREEVIEYLGAAFDEYR